jgi:LuxR family transcriptional regulator, quorum-sensing system regulator CciR
MIRIRIVEEFVAEIATVDTVAGLKRALQRAKVAMGFDYFALTHHADILDPRSKVIRIHDYPEIWVSQFDLRRLGRVDPVHRASHTQNNGFLWSQIGNMIQMRPEDWAIIELARKYGIGEGYTVPANVPGESNGSVSFAMAIGKPIPLHMLMAASDIARRAFDCARNLWRMRPPPLGIPILTPAQIICARWAMVGKSAWEISQIEGYKKSTAERHLKHARERYGVEKQTLLITKALLDGTLSLGDLATM